MVFTDSCPSRFAISNGAKPISISILAWECRRKSKRLDLLRHSAVSLLINMGFSVLAIGERMGHEAEKITYRYAHLFPTVQTEMAEKLEMERMTKEQSGDMSRGDLKRF